MGGFIALYRQMVEWEWYTDGPCFKLFIHCLLKANYEEKHWRGIVIPRGSFVTSYSKLSQECGLSIKQVRTALDKLISTHELAKQSASQYTVISVVNYGLYQEYDNSKGQSNRHAKGQTNGKQRASEGQQLTNITNKQDNKDNDKDNGAIAPVKHHYLTNILLEMNFIVDENELFSFDDLFDQLLKSYTHGEVMKALYYVSHVMITADKEYKSKFWYFKKSIEKQLNYYDDNDNATISDSIITDDTNISDQELRELLKDI